MKIVPLYRNFIFCYPNNFIVYWNINNNITMTLMKICLFHITLIAELPKTNVAIKKLCLVKLFSSTEV